MTTLSRLEQNDPTLTEVTVGNLGGRGAYWPSDRPDLARLGDAIGKNTNLRTLDILNDHELTDMAANNDAFFDGLNRNTSIGALSLTCCDLSGEMARDILNRFVRNNSNIIGISLRKCAPCDGGTGILASVVTRCTNMNYVTLLYHAMLMMTS